MIARNNRLPALAMHDRGACLKLWLVDARTERLLPFQTPVSLIVKKLPFNLIIADHST